jgi:hypothetical protein
VERNRKAGQNPPRVVAPNEEEEEEYTRIYVHVSNKNYWDVGLTLFKNVQELFNTASRPTTSDS